MGQPEVYGTSSDFGTFGELDSDTGTFTYDPADDFDGLIIQKYRFKQKGIVTVDAVTELPLSKEYIWSNVAELFIHVGQAVRVDLSVDGLDEEIEATGQGKLISLNDDDDNHNDIEDRWELDGPISSETTL